MPHTSKPVANFKRPSRGESVEQAPPILPEMMFTLFALPQIANEVNPSEALEWCGRTIRKSRLVIGEHHKGVKQVLSTVRTFQLWKLDGTFTKGPK